MDYGIHSYLAPDRYYHNIMHIANMLNNSIEFNLTRHEQIKLNYAIKYHDVVYDPTSKTNEEDSVEVFLDKLYNGVIKVPDDITITEIAYSVSNMIMATQYHVPNIKLSNYIIDLDLWDLADSDKYNSNNKLIRKEYSMYSDEEFYTGRNKWIKSMLIKERIYHTDYCILNGFENRARVNLMKGLTG